MLVYDTDARDIERALAEMGWIIPVPEWYVETGLNSQDKPAVYVWVILENVLEQYGGPSYQTREALREQIWERVMAHVTPPPHWVYIRFRSVEEQRQAETMEIEE